ncbi:hypothetical protein PVAP13_3NG078001 [Panicum virgatum]|uniref:Uncharacterized protein n=1 Tax=Panicum virgatum TaxID=38727 RepID=A0A8T0U4H9_PANVG|nr:hypothetical protein PVAP13_3NG078001 [Panicum virgatum]
MYTVQVQIRIHEAAAKNFLVHQEHHAAAGAGLQRGQGGLTHRTASRKGHGVDMQPRGVGRDESICSCPPRAPRCQHQQQQQAPSSGGRPPADKEDEDHSSADGDLQRMAAGRGLAVLEQEQQRPGGLRSNTRANLQMPSSLTVEEDVKPATRWSSSPLIWERHGFWQQ